MIIAEENIIEGRRCGKAKAIGNINNLVFNDYLKKAIIPPDKFDFWKNRKPFPKRMFGNDNNGDCTRAKQAIAAMRMERIEQKHTIDITDKEVLRVYYEMTTKLYGGGDTGAYEIDALNEWRREETTFRDTKGRPLTIDAFTRINQINIPEVKTAIWLSGAHGIATCFALPAAWQRTNTWDIPEDQLPVGKWTPGSWGGHSTWAVSYNQNGILIPTWDVEVTVSWRAFAIYCDEAYSVIDSINKWKKRVGKLIDMNAIHYDVNSVSDKKIA